MAQENSMAVSEFLAKAELLKQGAEARVYRAHFLGKPTIVKQRFPKRYRHPTLDEKLTHRRTTQEVRSILRCRKAGKFSSSFRNRISNIGNQTFLIFFFLNIWFFPQVSFTLAFVSWLLIGLISTIEEEKND